MTELIPVHIGVQWAWATLPDIVFSPTAHAPNAGGNQHIPFPNAMVIRGYKWQSSVKIGSSEVLMHFQISPEGHALGEPGAVNLFSVHHVTGRDPQTLVDSQVFGHDLGLVVPAGWIAWVYGEGSGIQHPAPVEVQTTLFLTPA